ncbi:MAG TPA: hypothetical protein VHN98_02995 [Acidimicrobiales bacterium]|nr:hypothetical protein [Acidimicrobiales bacterium]
MQVLGPGDRKVARDERAAGTARPTAKDGLRERAREMRAGGASLREIVEALDVSKSTASLWCRDVPLTEEQRAALAARGPATSSARAASIRANAERRRQRIRDEARAQVPALAESELFVAGVVAYWAEGTKNKPWRTGERVAFMNSDPRLVLLFLAWLELVGVSRDRIDFRLSIHETADIDDATRYWSEVVDEAVEASRKPTVKRHNPKTVRKNVGAHYHGCLIVSVRRSGELNLRIEGWFGGIVAAVAARAEPRAVTTLEPPSAVV